MVVRKALLSFAVLLFASPIFAENDSEPSAITIAKINETEETLLQPKKLDVQNELMVKEAYQYYNIDGNCVADLRRQMNQKGTKWHDGKVYAALTTWDIRYRYDVAHKDGKHSVKSVNTDVAIVFHLPRRTPCTDEPEELAERWNDYLVSLKEHEYGHRDLAVKAAADINDSLASLENFDSSRDLHEEVKQLVKAKLKELREVQISYDDETQHGETQGALLD